MDREDMTGHALKRQQQRGIPALSIDLVVRFGRSEPTGSGASRYFLDKAGRRRLQAYAGSMAGLIESQMNVFAIVGADGALITVGHQHKRVRSR